MISAQLDELIGVLENQERQYQQLLDVMAQEKEAAMVSNARAMDAVVQRKQEVMAAMARMERQRKIVLQQIAAQVRLPMSDLTLSVLARHAEPGQAKKIDRLSHSMARLLDQVKRANEENRVLVQHCLGLVRNTLGFFKQWLAPASVYGNSGQINGGQFNGRLVSGVV